MSAFAISFLFSFFLSNCPDISSPFSLTLAPTLLSIIMLSSIFTLALVSTTAFAIEQEKRQATDAGQFTSAASKIISQYIPSTALPGLESAVAAAASAASVSGDAASLLYSALLAESAPGWFKSAIPDGWSTQIAALEGSVDALRPTGASPGGPIVPVVIAITTTDSAGSTFTTSVTSTAPSATGYAFLLSGIRLSIDS